MRRLRVNKLRCMNKSSILAITFLILLIGMITAGSTLAYLHTKAEAVENTFIPATTDCEVNEEFDGTKKKNVKVTNTGNVDMYIRVKLMFYWVDSNGNVVAKNSWEDDITPANSKWKLGKDGYYYYTESVEAKKSTENIIDEITLKNDTADNTRQVLEVMATCIQAEPSTAVLDAWGTFKGGSVTGVSEKILQIE